MSGELFASDIPWGNTAVPTGPRQGRTPEAAARAPASAPTTPTPGLMPATPDLGELLGDVSTFVRRYVVLDDAQQTSAALWVAHTHAIDAAAATPYLSVTSATKRSGKTRLLEVFDLVVRRPWLTGRTTSAALVRKLHKDKPTLLLDESDAAFNGPQEYSEALRGALNAGHRRGGKVSLCVGEGKGLKVEDSSVFGPKAIAGIGNLPDTIADRAIPIRLQRRRADEPVERFRHRDATAAAAPVRRRLEVWAASGETIARLRDARPDLPVELNDRAQDAWEPFLALADEAGGEWPARARRAALTLSGEAAESRDEDLSLALLADVRVAFDEAGAAFLASALLVERLVAMLDRPWRTYRHGQPLTPHGLARRLGAFGIVPRPSADGSVRGYHRERFNDAWGRYGALKCQERQYANENGPKPAIFKVSNGESTDTLKNAENVNENGPYRHSVRSETQNSPSDGSEPVPEEGGVNADRVR